MIPGTDLLEALPVAVYTTDAAGRITFYNRAAAEMWGHNPQLLATVEVLLYQPASVIQFRQKKV